MQTKAFNEHAQTHSEYENGYQRSPRLVYAAGPSEEQLLGMSAWSPALSAACTCNPQHHKRLKQKQVQGSEAHICLATTQTDAASQSKAAADVCSWYKAPSMGPWLTHSLMTKTVTSAVHGRCSGDPVSSCLIACTWDVRNWVWH